jgi:hypothetical protein
MFCCKDLIQATDLEIITKSEVHTLRDGRIFNEIDTEYFIRSEDTDGAVRYLGINYCPFCGKAVSRGLWAAEKKR